jgi:hypothetical protein
MKNKTPILAWSGALAGIAGLATYAFVLRPRHLRWGATTEEVAKPLPGDELASGRALDCTHAVTIHAPADQVWPWLVQMGQGRGGFYSYAWLENLVGCRMENADRIHPEFQHLELGAPVYLHPQAPPLKVTQIEPGRSLVLGTSWAFVLEPIDARTTRLLVRGRGRFESPDLGPVLNFLCWRLVFEPAHFIMERKMMLGIKARAERAAGRMAAGRPKPVAKAA